MQKSDDSDSQFEQSTGEESFEVTENTEFFSQAQKNQQTLMANSQPILIPKVEPQEFDFEHNFPIELIFILYHSYKGRIQELCKKYQCSFIFGLNIIKFYGKDKNKLQQCQQKVTELTSKINYAPFKSKQDTEKSKPLKIFLSYYFNQKFRKHSIGILLFNKNVFAFTDQLSQAQLLKKQITLTKDKLIFPVRIRSHRNLNSQTVYKHIAEFLSKAFNHYKPQFDSYKLHIEINIPKTSIYIIGNDAKSCMLGKNTVKNILQGMICYTLKGVQLSQKEYKLLGKYFLKLSKYPIHLGKLSEKQYLLITKDTIMKQFVNNPKFIQLSKMNHETQIGIFLLPSFNRQHKSQLVHKICKQCGFHIKYQNYFQYFENTFITNQDSNSIKPLVKILLKVAEGLNQGKQRYEFMKKNQRSDYYTAENENDQLNYFFIGGKVCHQQLSERINRDVMCQKIEMKKSFVVQYNLSDEKQIDDVCWFENPENKEVTEIRFEDAKKGKYFYGKKKSHEGKILYKKQYCLTII